MVRPEARPRTVLVVDDSGLARAAVGQHLARRGLPVRSAGALAEAREVEAASVGAALLDLELEDGSGVDVALLLRAQEETLPIAFLTSATRGDLADRARELGPVFEKGTETAEAVSWVEARLREG